MSGSLPPTSASREGPRKAPLRQQLLHHHPLLDHTTLTYRFQGRDFRLTDVHGNVVKAVLA